MAQRKDIARLERGDYGSLFELMAGIEGEDDKGIYAILSAMENNPEISHSSTYANHKTALRAMAGKYERLMQQGETAEARKYLGKEKKQSVVNIVKKALLPNLVRELARKSSTRKNLEATLMLFLFSFFIFALASTSMTGFSVATTTSKVSGAAMLIFIIALIALFIKLKSK